MFEWPQLRKITNFVDQILPFVSLHIPLLGCYKTPLHFGSAETQYPMCRIDRLRGDIDLLRSNEEVCLASKHNPFDTENGGGR